MKNEKKAEAVVPVEQDKTYEELVNPDLTGEAAARGQQPNVGELGPDLATPNQTNGVDNETEYRSENDH